MATGIRRRHSKGCRSRDGGSCNCRAGWEAAVYSHRDGKKIRKTFKSEGEAKAWRSEAGTALKRGSLRAPKPTIVQQAWDAWYAGAKDGAIRNRSGHQFKPSALRAYEAAMRLRVLPALGRVKLSELRRPDLQDLADELLAGGLSPSAIQVTLLPVRAICRRAIARGELAVNPCADLHLPAVSGRRERFASPVEAAALIAAAPERDSAIWATAFYSGLRLGELRALRVADVDLAAGLIRVERGWDPVEGVIPLKSRAGRRRVPVVPVLRDHLLDHLARTGRRGDELIFGNTSEVPFTPNRVQGRADDAWKAAELDRITPHSCRHSFASLMIAAGVNAKALATFLGHGDNISLTMDRYGHLMPGSEEEAAELLDAYLTAQRERAEETARAAGGIATLAA